MNTDPTVLLDNNHINIIPQKKTTYASTVKKVALVLTVSLLTIVAGVLFSHGPLDLPYTKSPHQLQMHP